MSRYLCEISKLTGVAASFVVMLLGAPSYSCSQVMTVPDSQTAVDILDVVKSTLTLHPSLQSQRAQIEISRGSLKRESGLFNTLIQSNIQQAYINTPLATPQLIMRTEAVSPSLVTSLGSNETTITVSAGRLFRNGISVTPTFQLSRQTDNLYYPTGINSSNVGLLITIPLLRGKGRDVVAARETAARTEVSATALDLTQLISQLIQNVVFSYWNVVAAQRNVTIAREAEVRGRSYVENTQALIAADYVPRNDLNETTANLAQRSSARIAAEQSLTQTQLRLATDMGVDASVILNNIPWPTDELPKTRDQIPLSSSALQDYLTDALQRRGDYLSTQLRVEEAQTLLVAARNGLLPQVNLTLNAGYTGLQGGRAIENFLSATYTGVERPNTVAALSYSFPVRNEAAEGALVQANAILHQAEVQRQQVARSISEGIGVALTNVRSAVLRVTEADRSVLFFQASLSGARDKYRVGLGSVVEVLQIEDKLTAAMTDQVQAQFDYATAITQLRFATGTLFVSSQTSQQLDKNIFLTLPSTGDRKAKP